jgi:CBS domain-containing protein
MVPLSDYATVSEDATLSEAVAALKQSQAEFDPQKYRHRAVLVMDNDQKIIGKVDLWSILKSLEPKYEDMLSDSGPLHTGFTRKYQKAIIDSFNLWQDPLDQVCEKAAQIKVKAFMSMPTESEIIEPEASLSEAIHQLVLGRHQSLLVSEGKKVIGVLRLTDAYDFACDAILACNL